MNLIITQMNHYPYYPLVKVWVQRKIVFENEFLLGRIDWRFFGRYCLLCNNGLVMHHDYVHTWQWHELQWTEWLFCPCKLSLHWSIHPQLLSRGHVAMSVGWVVCNISADSEWSPCVESVMLVKPKEVWIYNLTLHTAFCVVQSESNTIMEWFYFFSK